MDLILTHACNSYTVYIYKNVIYKSQIYKSVIKNCIQPLFHSEIYLKKQKKKKKTYLEFVMYVYGLSLALLMHIFLIGKLIVTYFIYHVF